MFELFYLLIHKKEKKKKKKVAVLPSNFKDLSAILGVEVYSQDYFDHS